jgi:hypothetical protein
MCAGVADHFKNQVRAHLDILYYQKDDISDIITGNMCSSIMDFYFRYSIKGAKQLLKKTCP